MSRFRRSVQNSVSVSLVLMLLGLFTGVAAARVLGPEERGYLGIIVFWAQVLANAFRLPFSEALLVYCRHSEGQERTILAWSAARSVTKIVIILAVCTYLVAVGIFYLIASQQDLPYLKLALLLLALTMFSHTMNEVFIGLLYVEGRFDLVNTARVVMPATYSFGVLVVVIGGYGIEGFLWAQCASMVAALFFRLHYYPRRPRLECMLEVRDGILRVATSLHGLTLVTLLTKQIDKVILFTLAPTVFIGHYIVAFTMISPAQSIINTAISSIGLPAFSSLPQGSRFAAAERMLRAASSASVLTVLGVASLSWPLLPIIFGAAYEDAISITVLLSFAIVLQPVRTAASQILKALGQVRMVLISEIVYAAVFSTSYFALSGADLLLRVAASFSMANILGLVVLALALRVNLPELKIQDWIWPTPQSMRELMSLIVPVRWYNKKG